MEKEDGKYFSWYGCIYFIVKESIEVEMDFYVNLVNLDVRRFYFNFFFE